MEGKQADFEVGKFNSIEPSISDLLGKNIWTQPEKKVGKEVTINFLAVVAIKDNCVSINIAQKAGRTTKSALKCHALERTAYSSGRCTY